MYPDDSGILKPVCSETCDPEAGGGVLHSFVSTCPTCCIHVITIINVFSGINLLITGNVVHTTKF